MKTKSIWEGTDDSAPQYPALQGEQECDVVVIGGGISGITAAYLLAKEGKKVILLEAHRIGLGTTGNSTGNLYVTVDEHLSQLQKKWNKKVMKDVVTSRQQAIDLIESLVKVHNIDCDFRKTEFCYFSEKGDASAEKFMKDEMEALKEAGIQARTMEDGKIPMKYQKALVLPQQAQFHPLKYVRGLAANIGPNCRIYENSMVIDHDASAATVRTKTASVKAKAIIMATHVPKGLFLVHTVLGPYREFGIAAELLKDTMHDGIYWTVEEPKHSVRVMSANGKKYIMVIGDKFKTGQHQDTVVYIKGLDDFLKQRFEIGPIQFIWAGQQYRPADGLPYIGKQNGELYIMTGFSTDGLVYGTLGASIICDQIMGRKNQWEKLYDAGRHTPLKSAADFIKENANNAVKYMELLPGKVDVKSLNEVPYGEGKVLEIDGEKLAVYREENGQCKVVSAICTHLMCVVHWNGSEKSWDCPCHGSRFTTDGDVIEGPASFGLPKKQL